MDDQKIIELFWQRDEAAIAETERKYGSYCRRIAINLLGNREDAEECINDAMLRVWELIPPERPLNMKAWLGKIMRNTSIKCWEKNHAKKRFGSTEQRLDELEDVIPSLQDMERELEDKEVGALIDRWLCTLEREDRKLFVRRYWLGVPQKELAKELGVSPNSLAQRVYRLRQSLKSFLEKEDAFRG